MSVMEMPNGTVIRNKRSGKEYILGDFVNDVARAITMRGVFGSFTVDYINENVQEDFEVAE